MSYQWIEHYNFFTAMLVGLLSSGHCVVMCGGVVGVLSANIPMHHQRPLMRFSYLLSYNGGRLLSYAIAGALVGFSTSFFALKSHTLFQVMHILAGLMLVLIGLYICQWLNAISHIERLGKGLWSVVSPLAKKMLPLASPISAFPFGFVWGWLPCGLVYSTLTWSAASGSALQGAAIMLGFGLGTLPAMLSLGVFSLSLKKMLGMLIVRRISGCIIILFGANILLNTLQVT